VAFGFFTAQEFSLTIFGGHMLFRWIDPTVAEVYTIVNFLELCLNLNTQFASHISLNSSISKKKVYSVLLFGWQL
jgi:hypothetical protein